MGIWGYEGVSDKRAVAAGLAMNMHMHAGEYFKGCWEFGVRLKGEIETSPMLCFAESC
jgi:hypothetical protein